MHSVNPRMTLLFVTFWDNYLVLSLHEPVKTIVLTGVPVILLDIIY